LRHALQLFSRNNVQLLVCLAGHLCPDVTYLRPWHGGSQNMMHEKALGCCHLPGADHLVLLVVYTPWTSIQ
jgi:hypothetical protein